MTLDDMVTLARDVACPSVPVTVDTPLLSSGILDSFHVAAFLQEVWTRHRVRVDLNDIGVDNFDTPRQMLAFLQARS